MKKQVRELVEYAERCGFVLDGQNSKSHYVLRHPNGAVKAIASTPSDWRAFSRAKSEFRKLSGVDPDNRRRGHYRKNMPKQEFESATVRVESRSCQAERALDWFRSVCVKIRDCQESGEGDPAALCRELLDAEGRLVALGEPIPPYPFRMKYWG